MEAAQALSELTALSAQVTAAVVLGEDGSPVAATVDDERARDLAQAVNDLVAAAVRAAGRDAAALAQLEVSTPAGSVFVVRDGRRTIAATTAPEPPSGLVFYDLKTCLRGIAEEPKPRPTPRPRKKAGDAAA
ncbi:MAG TPA: roadblock/LC7 domain-containing protein [Gaiellaceae bacterium]|nr:roadblock/LC7 domain-containing protein [Gaiellaceae bacterium]